MTNHSTFLISVREGLAIRFVLALALLLVSGTVLAEDANLNADAKPAASDKDTAYLAASSELARIGQDTKNSILMLAAAQLEAMASSRSVDRSKTIEGEAITGSDKKAARPSLYSMAEEFAGTNETLLALIDASRGGPAMRGRTRGPYETVDRVSAGTTDVWPVKFNGGELAEVFIGGDGDTDLDLYVYDENGNLICRDIDPTDYAYCSWHPSWTGDFLVKIENIGEVYNEYTLLTN